MTGNPQLLDVLYATGDALRILLLLLGASLIIAAVFDAAERSIKKSRTAGPQERRQGGADRNLPRGAARRYFSSMR